MNFKNRILLFIGLLLTVVASAQTYKQAFKTGNKFLKEGNAYAAIYYYDIAFKQDSTKNKLLYNYAEALRLNNQYSEAKKLYKTVYSSDNSKEFPKTAFWLGMLSKNTADYPTAIKYWTLAKKRATLGTYEYLKSEQEIKSCQWASKNDSVYSVKIYHPSQKINTTASDFAPFPLSMEQIYFSRISPIANDSDYTHKNINILLGIKEGGVWDTIPVDTFYLNKQYNANASISPDKKRFYFTFCNDSSRCDIYVSNYNSGNISEPKYINTINTPIASTTQPFETKMNGKSILLFASNRNGGYGKYDLWYSELNEGEYSSPKNLGENINSIDNELTPYYDSNNNQLYFSSDWHFGFGGLDIFKSKGTINNFKEVKNVLKPINTSANDLYYIQHNDTIQGFLSSNRKGSNTLEKESCCNDIYRFEHYIPDTPKVDTIPTNIISISKVKTKENKTQRILVNLYFHNDEPNPRTWKTKTEFTYDEVYKNYIKLKGDYYEKAATQKEITILYSQYIEKGRRDLDRFLNVLYAILQTGKPVFIKLRGFASPLTKTDYNLNLSKRRIDSFKNQLKLYKGGIFNKYLENKKIKFIELPFGEFTSDHKVTDDPKDPAAIYSLGAALERRIEISFEYRP